MEGSCKRYSVRKGNSVTLICVTGLSGNPKPIVTWTNPQAKSISDNNKSHYVITGGPNVTLTVNNVTESDIGIWKCTVEVSNNNISVACPDPNPSSRTQDVEMEVTFIGRPLTFVKLLLCLEIIALVCYCLQFLQVNHWMSMWLQWMKQMS